MNKNILLIALMAVLLIGAVEAALTLNLTDTGTQTGAFNIGAGSTVMRYIVNCTWYAYATSFTNILQNTSSTNTFKFTTNLSDTSQANNTRITFSDPARDLQDSTYYLYATCHNDTGASSETSSTTAMTQVINIGSPICAVNLPFASRTTQSPTATWTATSGNATSATLYFGAGNPKSMTFGTASTRQQTWSYSLAVPESVYSQVYVTFSDGTDSTTCTSSDYVNINSGGNTKLGAIYGQQQIQIEEQKKSSNLLLLGIIIVVVYFITNKSKKK